MKEYDPERRVPSFWVICEFTLPRLNFQMARSLYSVSLKPRQGLLNESVTSYDDDQPGNKPTESQLWNEETFYTVSAPDWRFRC